MTYTDLGNALLILAAIPSALSVVIFSRVSWWQSRWGRHLMAYMSAVATITVLGCIKLVFGTHEWYQILRAGAYVALVYVLWWRMVFVWQAYREGSPNESGKNDVQSGL
jgi:hypothetical protein